MACIVSLDSAALIQFDRAAGAGLGSPGEAPGSRPTRVLLRPGSLLVFGHAAYNDYVHSIATVPRETIDDTVLNLKHCLGAAPGHFIERCVSRVREEACTLIRVRVGTGWHYDWG